MGGLSSFYIIQKLIKGIPCTTHVQNSGDYSVDGEVVRIRERDTTMLLAARASDEVVTVVFEGDEHVLMPARQTHASYNFEGVYIFCLEFL